MQSSYSLLFVKLGMSFHPLQVPYKQFQQHLTHSWMKMLWEKLSRFNLKAVIGNINWVRPREGDEFIMQVLLHNGHTNDALRRLNRMRVCQQLLFMSDVLTASGNKINPEVLSRRPPGEAWSNMTWPNEHPTDLDFQMWHRAMLSICPSQRGGTRVGRFIGPTHRIWRWTWNMKDSTLHHLGEEVFAPSRKPNRFHHLRYQPASHHNTICLEEPTLGGEGWRLTSSEPLVGPSQAPTSFLDVLRSWGNTWIWEHLQVSGGELWIHDSIADESLVAVTDGSYIRELYPNLCSATFVMECFKERGRIVGSFSETLSVANAYRGELLGLMAIHLILLSINKLHRDL